MAKSRSSLRDDLNAYTGDSANVIWVEPQKNLAINMAIRDAWPDIKAVAKVAFSLAEGSYDYSLRDFSTTWSRTTFTRAPWGPQQVWVQTADTSGAVYTQVLRSVHKTHLDTGWWLEFDEGWVDNRGGYIVQVYFNQKYEELGSDSATTDVPDAFITPRALFHLCGMEALKGHHTDVQAFRQQRPDFYQEAEDARGKNTVLPLADNIRLRYP